LLIAQNKGEWYPCKDDVWTLSFDDIDVVIDDELVEYRKALAEGYDVQYFVDGFAGWHSISSFESCLIKDPENFRIVDSIKEGDWVISDRKYPVKVSQIVDGKLFWDNENGCRLAVSDNSDSIKKWKPKYDEFCIFYNKNSSFRFIISKFNKKKSNHLYEDKNGDSYECCEPYTGHIPGNE